MNSATKRILLAEDDPQDAELTMMALADLQFDSMVDVVHDGQEALDYLYRKGRYVSRGDFSPIVVILDLKMPKLDGMQVLERIKSDPLLRRIPVVILTSSREEKDLLKSYDLGVNAFVVKPVDFNKFGEAVRLLGLFWVEANEVP